MNYGLIFETLQVGQFPLQRPDDHRLGKAKYSHV